MADCLFCRIVAGEIPANLVHEGKRTIAFRDIGPQAPTHVLVVPREHVENAAALAAADPSLLAEMVTAGALVAAAEDIAESGYRLVFNTGPDSGQSVYHVHLHLLGGEQLGHFGALGA
ncbi:MAG TPA: histidine triad nucleotide-binding protein [Mycobacteriales bacterium]|nr:histidine triad nucleotide-binding protein [Mycobacteriales bacterium]